MSGQADIQDDRRHLEPLQQRVRLDAVARRFHDHAVAAEDARNAVRQHRVVFH